MSAKKKITSKTSSIAEEPLVPYVKRSMMIFHSHEEQAEYELQQMASLSSKKILQQLRKLINLAYGMHGFDPTKLPKKHSIKIIQRG